MPNDETVDPATVDTATVDTVIVGAGVAGLAAARGLIAGGRSVRVLEARDRVGGRLCSVDRLDLGATWFWPSEPRIVGLAEDLGVATHRQHLEGDALFHVPGGAQRLDGNPLDVESRRFSDGAASLAEALAATLPEGTVRLGATVDTIRGDDTTIEARTADGAVVGRHLILAVPPSLAVARIDIRPGLDEGIRQIATTTPVWMGAMTKVVVRYAEPWWRHRGLAGAAISHVGPLREIHDMSGPEGAPAALFGFAPPTTVGQPTPGRDAVLAQLVDIFGPAAGTPLEILLQDWRQEAATSPPEVERLTDYTTYGHTRYASPALGGRLHWASTETATEAPGHIEGALAAADRAVRAILGATEPTKL